MLLARVGLNGLFWGVGQAEGVALSFVTKQMRGPKLAKPRNWIQFWKIKPGDEVMVISGDDKGRVGTVTACDTLRNQVKVRGCKLRKLVVDGKPLAVEKKIHYSNVLLLDPMLKVPTRCTTRVDSNGNIVRFAVKSGTQVPWPDRVELEGNKDPITAYDNYKDTPPEAALEKTYNYSEDSHAIRYIRQTMSKYNRTVR